MPKGSRVTAGSDPRPEVRTMLRWILTFLVLAIVAAVLGFGGIADAATDVARILFFVFLVALVLSVVFSRRSSTT